MAPVPAVPDPTDTSLVLAARRGEQGAFATLFERWFDRAYDVARNIVRNDDTAAEVAQDTFLSAWQGLVRLDNPDAFGGWVLRIARNKALNRLERERRSQPLATDVVTGAHDAGAPDPTGSSRLIETEAISEVRDRQELVWAAAAALGERDASVLDLHLRHGLGPAEIADELGVTANNAHQLLFRMRNRLGSAISGYLLWRNGRPRCAALAAAIDGAQFDAAVLKVIDRHAAGCDLCNDQRTRVVDPHRLFAATPILVAPALLKAKAARALSQAGVPVDPTSSGLPPGSSGSQGPGVEWPLDHGLEVPDAAHAVPPITGPHGRRGRRRRTLMVLAAVAVIVAGVLLVTTRSGDRREIVVTASPSTVAASSPTTTASASTTVEPSTSTTLATTTTTLATTTTTLATTTTITTTTLATTTTITPVTTVPVVPETTGSTPTTAPSIPSTTAPLLVTTTIATTTSTTVPPSPAPVIVRFTSTSPAGVTLLCAQLSWVPRRFLWSTTDATSAVMTITGVDTVVDPTGTRTTCAPSGGTVTLTAIGPGGTVQATTAVP